ncbi:MAG: gluconate 2-dehydrogenase subunit 3 family protein [Acidobacteria bacterium]|nr:gluconate 2-dehydrogenase subunit 3 family protein [Acidobacteriota bacterium]
MMPLDSISGGCDLKRRIFLTTAAVATAACNRKSSSLRFFTADEAAILDAWLDVLIPGDQDPGARQAGVVHYIDLQLTRKFRKLQPAYRSAIAALGRLAVQRGAPSYESLSFEARTAIATQMEQGALDKSLFPDGGKTAFNMVLDHAMQGFYGSPRHGGNQDYSSWRMIGIPPMPVRGRQHYDIRDTYPQKAPVQG